MINIDKIIDVLSIFPFSFSSTSFLTLLYHYCYPSRIPFSSATQLLTTLPLSLRLLLIFTFLRLTSSTLAHATLNNFQILPDPPRWSNPGGDDDIVLITGGITGIGLEVVKQFRNQGVKVIVLDLVEAVLNSRVEGVHYYQCDVTDRQAITDCAFKIRQDVGQITVIINNAGIARGKTILTTSPEEFLLTYKVNVLGVHNILNEFLPYIISINHGHVMTMASSASYMSIPQLSEYACSKAAVLALHEVLRSELVHRYNAPCVRTSVICPTKVATQMGNAMKDQENQFLSPTLAADTLASQMISIINSGYSAHLITPHFAAALLPLVRVLPDWYRYLVNTIGRTQDTITDEGNREQHAHYTIVDELDRRHRLNLGEKR